MNISSHSVASFNKKKTNIIVLKALCKKLWYTYLIKARYYKIPCIVYSVCCCSPKTHNNFCKKKKFAKTRLINGRDVEVRLLAVVKCVFPVLCTCPYSVLCSSTIVSPLDMPKFEKKKKAIHEAHCFFSCTSPAYAKKNKVYTLWFLCSLQCFFEYALRKTYKLDAFLIQVKKIFFQWNTNFACHFW